MTTIAVRNGVIAADSRTTVQTDEGGARVFQCEKLYRKTVSEKEVILATAGESFSSLVFVDWYGSGKEPPELLVHGGADFTVLALTHDGLYEYDMWCRGEKILNEFYAVGSGAKAAMAAMYMGASAKRAVEIACMIDPYSAPPISAWKLKPLRSKPANKPRHRKDDREGSGDNRKDVRDDGDKVRLVEGKST